MHAPQNADQRGVSSLIAVAFLTIATLVAGGIAFIFLKGQVTSLSSNTDLKVQSMDLVSVSSGGGFSGSFKNTGTVTIDRVEVDVHSDSISTLVMEDPIPPGGVRSAFQEFDQDIDAGTSHLVTITAFKDNTEVFKKTISITAR